MYLQPTGVTGVDIAIDMVHVANQSILFRIIGITMFIFLATTTIETVGEAIEVTMMAEVMTGAATIITIEAIGGVTTIGIESV